MATNVNKLRAKSAKRIAAKRARLAGNPAVLATGVFERDNMKTGHQVAHKVMATARVSIGRDFIAPDIAPVPTVATELEKGRAGWTDRSAPVPVVGYEPVPPTHTASGKRGTGRGVAEHRPVAFDERGVTA